MPGLICACSKDKVFCKGTTFFYKQFIFDPRLKNCLGFSKELPQKIV